MFRALNWFADIGDDHLRNNVTFKLVQTIVDLPIVPHQQTLTLAAQDQAWEDIKHDPRGALFVTATDDLNRGDTGMSLWSTFMKSVTSQTLP